MEITQNSNFSIHSFTGALTALLILLYIVYGHFHDLRAELTISTEAIWPTKLKIFTIRAFLYKVY